MSSTYVMGLLCLLPKGEQRAAGIADDRIRAGRPTGLVLQHFGTELHCALGLGADILDLDVGYPAADLPLLRHDGRERPRVAGQHGHPRWALSGLPPKEFL